MFSTTGLFKNVPCPEGERCAIISCIFSHDLRPKASNNVPAVVATNEAEHEHKRRKLGDTSFQSLRNPEPVPAAQPAATINNGSYKGPLAKADMSRSTTERKLDSQMKGLSSLQKKVTPPPLQNGSRAVAASNSKLPPKKAAVKETLNPRQIPHDPAGHSKRTLFLKYLHGEMHRLNEEVKKGSHADKEVLSLSENELIKAALDEEEQIARENANVYANIIKNRVATYKKMKVEDWIKHAMASYSKKKEADVAPKEYGPLITGLTHEEECLFLDDMISDQTHLAKHGYIPTPPTDTEMNEARLAVAASLNYEVCDRCKSRFRVYPDRRAEDGALTTNGPCVYHWARPVYPKRERTDAIKGVREAVFGCCGEPLGSKGCTEHETHVFKINDSKRLASVLPFINTPENPSPAKAPNGKVPAALTFDCEMGYTVCGFELMRLTAVTWPEGDPCIDVLVRPQGAILDFNTRFSGISPEVYNSAVPYNGSKELDSLLPPPPPGKEASFKTPKRGSPMPIVDSPTDARDLLCSYITPSTPLIGHALENDLNVVRLCHPRIIDTVMLFPHPKGLPIRYGLKMLTKQRLDRDIQMGGANGHDSMEDARATGELVRFAVKKRWEGLRTEGFKIEKGVLVPPLPSGLPPSTADGTEVRVLGGGTGIKRQRIQVPGEPDAEVLAKKQHIGN